MQSYGSPRTLSNTWIWSPNGMSFMLHQLNLKTCSRLPVLPASKMTAYLHGHFTVVVAAGSSATPAFRPSTEAWEERSCRRRISATTTPATWAILLALPLPRCLPYAKSTWAGLLLKWCRPARFLTWAPQVWSTLRFRPLTRQIIALQSQLVPASQFIHADMHVHIAHLSIENIPMLKIKHVWHFQ